MTHELPPAIGRYEVVALAGTGATGVVYRARDPVIGRTLAIKMIASLATLPPEERKEFRERFIREAQFAGNLHHQNIATLYDIGEEDGLPWMALEFVEGESLTRRLSRTGPLDPDEAIRIVRQVAEGLAHAHARGVVHRDIKPDNILLDPEGRAVITDFGIARISSNGTSRVMDLQGTPHFMSPEQVLGRSIDGRSDLFSLGVVLYALITSKRPFVGDHLTTVGQQIVHGSPQPYPPGRAAPPRLAAIIDHLLQKDPGARFASAKELVAALDALGVPVATDAPPQERRAAPVRPAARPSPPVPAFPMVPGGPAAAATPPVASRAAAPPAVARTSAPPRAAAPDLAPAAAPVPALKPAPARTPGARQPRGVRARITAFLGLLILLAAAAVLWVGSN